jgi:hypothetical protein
MALMGKKKGNPKAETEPSSSAVIGARYGIRVDGGGEPIEAKNIIGRNIGKLIQADGDATVNVDGVQHFTDDSGQSGMYVGSLRSGKYIPPPPRHPPVEAGRGSGTSMFLGRAYQCLGRKCIKHCGHPGPCWPM